MNIKSLLNLLFLLALISSLAGCNNDDRLSNATARCKKDIAAIEDSYMMNIEAMRLYLNGKNEPYFPDSIGAQFQEDPNVFFFFSEFLTSDGKWHNYKDPVCKHTKVFVDDIYYNKDSLFCVALIIIEHTIDSINGEEKRDDKSHWFNGEALIGYREKIDDRFKIYPFGPVNFHLFPTYDKVSRPLRKYYYNFKGDGPGNMPWCNGEKYVCGINDPRFFDTAPELKKMDSVSYKFQYFGTLGNIPAQYIYYSNIDSVKYFDYRLTDEDSKER